MGCAENGTPPVSETPSTLADFMAKVPDLSKAYSLETTVSRSMVVSRDLYAPDTSKKVIAYSGLDVFMAGVYLPFANLLAFAKTKIAALDLSPSVVHELGSGAVLDATYSQDMGRLRWEKSEDGNEMRLYWSVPPIPYPEFVPHDGLQIYCQIKNNNGAWDSTIYIHILPSASDPDYEQSWLIQCDGITGAVTSTQLGANPENIPQAVSILEPGASRTTIHGYRKDLGHLYNGIADGQGIGFSWEGGGYEFYTKDFDLIATGADAQGTLAYRLAYLKAADSGKKIGIDRTSGSEKVWIDDGNGVFDIGEDAVAAPGLLVGDSDSPGLALEASADGPFLFSSGDNAFLLGTTADPSTNVLPSGFACDYQSTLVSLKDALLGLEWPAAPDYAALETEIANLANALSSSFPTLP